MRHATLSALLASCLSASCLSQGSSSTSSSASGSGSSAAAGASGLPTLPPTNVVVSSKAKWSDKSTCPSGFTAVGLQRLDLRDEVPRKQQNLMNFICDKDGCKGLSLGSGAQVESRCMKGVACVAGTKVLNPAGKNDWSEWSTCEEGYTPTGVRAMDLVTSSTGGDKGGQQGVNSYECTEKGCRIWCWGAVCQVYAQCCKPAAETKVLKCEGGIAGKGSQDKFSPWSPCPATHTATGFQKLHLLGPVEKHDQQINDMECTETGCRALCSGSDCEVQSRCCAVEKAPPKKPEPEAGSEAAAAAAAGSEAAAAAKESSAAGAAAKKTVDAAVKEGAKEEKKLGKECEAEVKAAKKWFDEEQKTARALPGDEKQRTETKASLEDGLKARKTQIEEFLKDIRPLQVKLRLTIDRVNKIFVDKYKASMADLKFSLVILKNLGLMVSEPHSPLAHPINANSTDGDTGSESAEGSGSGGGSAEAAGSAARFMRQRESTPEEDIAAGWGFGGAASEKEVSESSYDNAPSATSTQTRRFLQSFIEMAGSTASVDMAMPETLEDQELWSMMSAAGRDGAEVPDPATFRFKSAMRAPASGSGSAGGVGDDEGPKECSNAYHKTFNMYKNGHRCVVVVRFKRPCLYVFEGVQMTVCGPFLTTCLARTQEFVGVSVCVPCHSLIAHLPNPHIARNGRPYRSVCTAYSFTLYIHALSCRAPCRISLNSCFLPIRSPPI